MKDAAFEFDDYQSPDGVRIRWARAAVSAPRACVVVAQGRREFIEKYAPIAAQLNSWGCDVWTFDWRGQGGSARELDNPHKGWVETFDRYLEDLDGWLHARVLPPTEGLPHYLLAHSMGGHLALRYLHDHPDVFDAAALSSPMVGIRMGIPQPLARRVARRMVRRGRGERYAPGRGDYSDANRRFAGNVLTSDRERFDWMTGLIAAQPALALGGPTWGWLAAALDSVSALNRRGYAESIEAPVLVALAGGDRVVSNRMARRFAKRLPAADVLNLPRGCRHEIPVEADRFRGPLLARARTLFGLEKA